MSKHFARPYILARRNWPRRRYNGAALRAIRAKNGVGRPPIKANRV